MPLIHRGLEDAASGMAPSPMPSEQVAAMEREAERAVAKYKGLVLVLAIGYALIGVLSTALIVYMRRNRTVAFRGDTTAARKVILPAYLPLLCMLMVVSFFYSIYFWIFHSADVGITRLTNKVENEVYYSGRLFFMVLVTVYLYQKSVTTPALRRATVIAVLLSTYNIPVTYIVDQFCDDKNHAYWIPHFSRILLVVFYLWVLVNPPQRASKRSIREYCVFVLIYFVLFFIYSELFHQGKNDAGFAFAYANTFWGSLCPLVIWRVLKADTEHWRGLGRRAVALQTLFRQKHRINERISSRGLHVLIEMHRKYIIDFAYLELKRKIGTGSSAVVFNGVLHSKTPVAVKVYSPAELTDEIVAEFSHEAALCAALHHPNIVKFYGMCVCPPTICLVSELCQGSLDDVTKAIARRPHDIARQQLMVDLNYMIDATRAVAYLHSFSPAFLHRDIKPANFLVDRHCVVKLTDFGESRSLPKECIGMRQGSSSVLSASTRQHDTPVSFVGRPSTDGYLGSESLFTTAPPSRRPAMTVRGTAEYMAPELIQGKAGTALYGEAADIFSLAITLWDIAYPVEEKYPTTNGNHLKVFEAVLAGERPGFTEGFHPGLRELLTKAWDPRPERRPSALVVLHSLEKIQQEVSCDVAVMLSNAMEKKIMISKKGCTTEHTVAGQDLVYKMLEFDVVGSIEEALRTGNGLMSSGFLHHGRHLLGFENSSEQYFFDEKQLDALLRPQDRLFLPPIVERRGSSATDMSSTRTPIVHRDEDHESEFSRSVGPGTKSDEERVVESASVATTIGTTMSELLRFGPRRKLSRTGSTTADHEDTNGRMSAAPVSQVTSSQWANTTNADSNVCPCKRLGAGMMYVMRGGGSAKRFRRTRRAASNGCGHGSGSGGHALDMAMNSSSASGMALVQTVSTTNDGLTARLLMNEFLNTGDSNTSAGYDLSPAATPLSASDVEMGFHVVASEEEDDDDDHEHVVGAGQYTHSRRTLQQHEGTSSSTFDGSSSVGSPRMQAVDVV